MRRLLELMRFLAGWGDEQHARVRYGAGGACGRGPCAKPAGHSGGCDF